MDKKLVLAVAGSGKTYLISNSIDPNKRNLILAFTHENIKNINFELLERFGEIPENTIVSTFHSFLFGDCIQPYHQMICDLYKVKSFKCEGVMFLKPPEAKIGNEFNKNYVKDICLRHYIPYNKYYCSRMAKLVIKSDPILLQVVINRINKFYDALYIDEYQDFRNNEFEFLRRIIGGFNGDVLLVGDYYQHSVSGDNNTGAPFGTTIKPITIQEYRKKIKKIGITIDDTILSKSRRCSESVCALIKTKMGIEITSFNDHSGEVVFISDITEATRILSDDSICKLVFNDSRNYSFPCINWSYSKGDTFEKTCVILTKDTSKLLDDDFDCEGLAPITRNMLYVALTRSRTDVYLLPKNVFDKLKSNYYGFTSLQSC